MLFGRQLYFQENNIGVQSKDGSVAVLANIDLLSNKKGLDAYKKNWRYDSGGEIFLYNSRLHHNRELTTADKNSRIFVHDSFLDQAIEQKVRKKKGKSVTIVSSDGVHNKRATVKKLWRFPEEKQKTIHQVPPQFFKKINPKVRGSRYAK